MTRRIVTGSVTAGAVIGAVSWLLGVVPVDAALIGVLLAAVLAIPRTVGDPWPTAWPHRSVDTAGAAYYEVRRIATMFRTRVDRSPASRSRLNPRLRSLAESRLNRMGVGWQDDEARRLLGDDVYDMLGGAPPAMATDMLAEVERVLDRLDDLPDTPTSGSRGTT